GTGVQVLEPVVTTAGRRRHFAIQKVLFALAMAGIVVLGFVLAFGSLATFSRHLSTIGGLDYNKVISTAGEHGYTHPGFSLSASLLFGVFAGVAISASLVSVSIGGELRRDRRS